MTVTLETERLILRQPQPKDWEGFRDFSMSDRAAGIGGPYTLGYAWRMFAAELGHWDIRGYGMFAVTTKDDDTALGFVGPWYPADWPETEIAWMVWDKAEGKGIAFEAAQAALDYAFNTLGWDTAVSYIAPGIDRSVALAQRLGAAHDPDAPQPKPDAPCHVYRHPKPEAA
jgi:RimJ/RimL family protein N-acetyltransferase